MHVFYGVASGHAHRDQGRGDDAHVGVGQCIGIGGVRIDQMIANYLIEAVSPLAVEATLFASQRVIKADVVQENRRRILDYAACACSTRTSRSTGVRSCSRRSGNNQRG